MEERTLVLIKPDAIKRDQIKIIEDMIKEFIPDSTIISEQRWQKVPIEIVREHYNNIRSKSYFEPTVEFISNGPVISMVIEGSDIVKRMRDLCGPTDPDVAEWTTIRGRLKHDSLAISNEENRALENSIHSSDSVENAIKEICLWHPLYSRTIVSQIIEDMINESVSC